MLCSSYRVFSESCISYQMLYCFGLRDCAVIAYRGEMHFLILISHERFNSGFFYFLEN